MMRRGAELLAIGSELLEPGRIDTNGSYLSRCLGERGIGVRYRTVVGDAVDDLVEAFRVAIARCDLVLATGGLGPTVDDLTREAISRLLGLRLVEDEGILRDIEERFRRHGLAMAPSNRRQAQVPEGAEVLPNPLGTAPGLRLRAGGTTVVLLPGVPAEMKAIFEASVRPGLPETGESFVYRVFKISGLPESEVDRRLSSVHRGVGEVSWTILAAPGQVEIHLREKVAEGGAPDGLERLDHEIGGALGIHLFGRDEQTLGDVLGGLLHRAGQTVAVAESLTGGTISRRIAAVPGASRYFRGGAVCYSDDAKLKLAGVRRETLAEKTAVSPEVAMEMAEGIRGALLADWGLSATGYAGPGGAGSGQTPGTVILGLAGPGICLSREMRLPGDRDAVQERSALLALDLLRRALLGGAL